MDNQYYKIVRNDLEIFFMFNPSTEELLQVKHNNIIISKGQFIGWENSTKDEFFDHFNAIVNKISKIVQ